jgi:nicotinate phosphoribosyltransferase
MESWTPGSLLLTDFYQLAMLQAYYQYGMTHRAAFEFFVRRLPPTRRFLLAAGLETVVDFLEQARFTLAELEWMRASGRLSDAAIESLAAWRFTGDVDAMPEGTVFFAHEPVLRVTAPLPEAQLIETRLVNLLHLQTVIASKATRLVLAAGGRTLTDFGLRRAHGAEAGLLAARAAYLAGFDATATTPAGPLFGIPVVGTMAHSFIQAHDNEARAFENFARARPSELVLLIDIYDYGAATHTVVELAHRLAADSIMVSGVRIDSGDLGIQARRVRAILDEAGLQAVRIVVSGGLDEHEVAALVTGGAPIDSFGIGTSLTTASDAPALDAAFKLVEYADRPRRKRSPGKAMWPGRKQVFRYYDEAGLIAGDTLALHDAGETGKPLLVPVMRGGRRVAALPDPAAIRAHTAAELTTLPQALRELAPGESLDVTIAPALRTLAESL